MRSFVMCNLNDNKGRKMRISIFGLGYVGCVSLGCLAQNGFDVIGIDVNRSKVDLVNQGLATIVEKDIDKIIRDQHALGRITATTDHYQAVLTSDLSIICVGTPSTERGSLNLEYIYTSARQIGEAIGDKNSHHIVVIRSTVLPGTNHRLGEIIAEASGKKRNEGFSVVSNPEFLREGSAVEDYYNPPFTLIGTDSPQAANVMRDVYEKVNGEFVESDILTAEIIKYVNNSYHALKVTFANEVGNICKKLGIDSREVMRVFCLDRQLNISPYYFKPGFAYGGSCLPKDLKALKTLALDHAMASPVLESIEASNQNHIAMATELIKSKGGKKVGILGVAFKEGTDDLRYSPIIKVIEDLLPEGYEIKAHDSFVQQALLIGANREYIARNLPVLPGILTQEADEILAWADTIVLNRKEKAYIELPARYPCVQFIDLVGTGSARRENYEGICW